ncbi:MAG: TRAP transporter small permease [Alphaproteobacteria bacterium]
MFARITDYIGKALMALASGWAFVLAFVVVADIVTRILNVPFQGATEIIANSIVMIAFLQFAYAVRVKAMLRVDALIMHLGAVPRRTLLSIGYLLGAFFFGFIFYSTLEPANYSWVTGHYEGEGALRVPSWPTYLTILLGSGLATINYILLLIEEVTTAGGVQESQGAAV